MYWDEYEEKCYELISKNFKDFEPEIKMERRGGSNARIADVEVFVDKNGKSETFYIEVKMPIAQCGQFVVKYDDVTEYFDPYLDDDQSLSELPAIVGREVYADLWTGYIKTKSGMPTVAKILAYLNENYDIRRLDDNIVMDPKDADLPLSESEFYEFISEHYKRKKVKYFMFQADCLKGYVLVKLEDLGQKGVLTHVGATCRRKASGSSPVGPMTGDDVYAYMKSMPQYKNILLSHEVVPLPGETRKRMFCYFNEQGANLDREVFVMETIDSTRRYMLRYKGVDPSKGIKYEVRKLSDTKNPTVVFSIEADTDAILHSSHNVTLTQFALESLATTQEEIDSYVQYLARKNGWPCAGNNHHNCSCYNQERCPATSFLDGCPCCN